ncbi:hypothetical protein TcasGA2_TC002651 [Tribolium castaneum]|uniref:Uncharacterized protein n=1 Tax=Tribolium castaneum TaxID=7070 RepID=D6WER8_TRICA|nr:hypothetical protein TcasGA2_TC002651 [Tribolium castaneum]
MTNGKNSENNSKNCSTEEQCRSYVIPCNKRKIHNVAKTPFRAAWRHLYGGRRTLKLDSCLGAPGIEGAHQRCAFVPTEVATSAKFEFLPPFIKTFLIECNFFAYFLILTLAEASSRERASAPIKLFRILRKICPRKIKKVETVKALESIRINVLPVRTELACS